MDEFVSKHWSDFTFKRLTRKEMDELDSHPPFRGALEAAYKELDRVMEILLKIEYLYFERKGKDEEQK